MPSDDDGTILFTGGALDRLKADLRAKVGDDFAAASEHKFTCRCAKCLNWWARIGPDDDGYGPFARAEVNAEQRRIGREETK